MTAAAAQTYYLLRAKASSVGDGPYVGLASDGVEGMVSDHLQARRFASIEEAEAYCGTSGETADTFEIEVRTSV